MENVERFVKHVTEEDFQKDTGRSSAYKVMEYLNAGGTYAKADAEMRTCMEQVFNELWQPDAYKKGFYRLMGWRFDFKPHLKRFLVDVKHFGWMEIWSFSKTTVRQYSSNPSWIMEIVEIDKVYGEKI